MKICYGSKSRQLRPITGHVSHDLFANSPDTYLVTFISVGFKVNLGVAEVVLTTGLRSQDKK